MRNVDLWFAKILDDGTDHGGGVAACGGFEAKVLELAAERWIDIDPTAEDTPCRGGREVGIVE